MICHVCLFFFQRKQRRKNDGPSSTGKDSSPPPSEPPTSGLINSNENPNQSSVPSVTPSQTHSLNSSSHLLYLQPEYAVFTRALAECNIHELIRQPTGVDKNEWIANNSSYFREQVNFPVISIF